MRRQCLTKSLKVRAHIRAGEVDECQQAFSDCVTRFLKLGIPVTKASDYCLPLMDECKEKNDEDA